MSDTVYIVYRKTGDNVLEYVGRTSASTREGAAQKVALEKKQGGEFVPIPERSYEVVPIALEVETKAIVKK